MANYYDSHEPSPYCSCDYCMRSFEYEFVDEEVYEHMGMEYYSSSKPIRDTPYCSLTPFIKQQDDDSFRQQNSAQSTVQKFATTEKESTNKRLKSLEDISAVYGDQLRTLTTDIQEIKSMLTRMCNERSIKTSRTDHHHHQGEPDVKESTNQGLENLKESTTAYDEERFNTAQKLKNLEDNSTSRGNQLRSLNEQIAEIKGSTMKQMDLDGTMNIKRQKNKEYEMLNRSDSSFTHDAYFSSEFDNRTGFGINVEMNNKFCVVYWSMKNTHLVFDIMFKRGWEKINYQMIVVLAKALKLFNPSVFNSGLVALVRKNKFGLALSIVLKDLEACRDDANQRDLDTPMLLFKEIKEKSMESSSGSVDPDLCAYNSLIQIACLLGKVKDAMMCVVEQRHLLTVYGEKGIDWKMCGSNYVKLTEDDVKEELNIGHSQFVVMLDSLNDDMLAVVPNSSMTDPSYKRSQNMSTYVNIVKALSIGPSLSMNDYNLASKFEYERCSSSESCTKYSTLPHGQLQASSTCAFTDDFYKTSQEFADFYGSALVYLTYISVLSLSKSFKLDLAIDLSFVALLGESTVDTSKLLASCAKIDHVKECCEQICQNAITEAASTLTLRVYDLSNMKETQSTLVENLSLFDEALANVEANNKGTTEVELLAAMVGKYKVLLVMGVIERDDYILYCSVLFFDPQGHYLGKHRKLMPTALERIIWGFEDGSTIPVFDTPLGKIGAAIYWENKMLVLRTAMYAKGVEMEETAGLAYQQQLALSGEVEEVSTLDQFKAAISWSGATFVHFKAHAHLQCEQIFPFDTLCERYPLVTFIMDDIEASPAAATSQSGPYTGHGASYLTFALETSIVLDSASGQLLIVVLVFNP